MPSSFLIWLILEDRAEFKKKIVQFLVQMTTRKFASEIYCPLFCTFVWIKPPLHSKHFSFSLGWNHVLNNYCKYAISILFGQTICSLCHLYILLRKCFCFNLYVPRIFIRVSVQLKISWFRKGSLFFWILPKNEQKISAPVD